LGLIDKKFGDLVVARILMFDGEIRGSKDAGEGSDLT
jgi:hypothetical protein